MTPMAYRDAKRVNAVTDEQNENGHGGGDNGRNGGHAEPIQPDHRRRQFTVAGEQILDRSHPGNGGISGRQQEKPPYKSNCVLAPYPHIMAGEKCCHVFEMAVAVDR